MARAVLDPNVLIAALLSSRGAPAQLLQRWIGGDFELVVSDHLLDELSRALARPKLTSRVSAEQAAAFVELLRTSARLVPDGDQSPRRSRDPGDDYLLALAASTAAVLVTGDDDLLVLEGLPVRTPRDFVGS